MEDERSSKSGEASEVAEDPVGSEPNRLPGSAAAVWSTSSSTPALASAPSSCRPERARLCEAVGGQRVEMEEDTPVVFARPK